MQLLARAVPNDAADGQSGFGRGRRRENRVRATRNRRRRRDGAPGRAEHGHPQPRGSEGECYERNCPKNSGRHARRPLRCGDRSRSGPGSIIGWTNHKIYVADRLPSLPRLGEDELPLPNPCNRRCRALTEIVWPSLPAPPSPRQDLAPPSRRASRPCTWRRARPRTEHEPMASSGEQRLLSARSRIGVTDRAAHRRCDARSVTVGTFSYLDAIMYWVADQLAGLEANRTNTSLGAASLIFDAYGGAINRVPAAETVVHRDSLFSIQYFSRWPGDGTDDLNWIRGPYRTMRPHVSGFAYQNYIDPDIASWKHAYYGSNLRRLAQVKRKYATRTASFISARAFRRGSKGWWAAALRRGPPVCSRASPPEASRSTDPDASRRRSRRRSSRSSSRSGSPSSNRRSRSDPPSSAERWS